MIAPLHKIDAVYCRYSSHRQDDSTSIEVQLEQCRAKAAGPVVEYIDKARTGRSINGRPQFLKLLADIKRGLVRRLFVYKFDRLGRAAEMHEVVADMLDDGVEVISVTEGTDEFTRDIHLLMARYYSKWLAERTRDGLAKRFEQGCFIGGEPPFGYTLVVSPEGRHQLAVRPDEAATIKWIIGEFLARPVGMKKLARELESKGIPTRRGRPWSFTTVKSIIMNRMLIGEVRYKRRKMRLNRETGNRVPHFNGESTHQIRRDESLRIIPDEHFIDVQQKIASRRRAEGATKAVRGVRPFTGHIFCECCMSVCYPKKSENRKGVYRSYECGNRQRKGVAACPLSCSIREDKLLLAIKTAYEELLQDRDAVISAAIKLGREQLDAGRAESTQVMREISDLKVQAGRLAEATVAQDVPAAAKRLIYDQMEQVQIKREAAEFRLRQIEVNVTDGDHRLAKAVRESYRRVFEDFSGIATPPQWNRFVENFIGPMVLRRDGSVGPKTPMASAGAEAMVNSNIAGGRYARYPQTASSIRQYAILSAREVFWVHFHRAA
jgi:DNA invertase Pin-like site-specific DNA recombinase